MLKFVIVRNLVLCPSKQFFLRYNGGGIFEIRSRLDESTVYDKDNNPMIYYAKDLFALNKERESKVKGIIKKVINFIISNFI